jgi:hypothetical protein
LANANIYIKIGKKYEIPVSLQLKNQVVYSFFKNDINWCFEAKAGYFLIQIWSIQKPKYPFPSLVN